MTAPVPPEPVPPEDAPALSVVVVNAAGFSGLRATARALRAQTARARIELVLVGPSEAALNAHDADEVEGFHSVRKLPAGTIDNVDRAAAPALLAARAPVVALIEDHAFPEPDWAERLIAAWDGPWAAVGPAVLNANPRTSLSWTNLFIAYGRWLEPAEPGEIATVPMHNASFRRDLLLPHAPRLADLLGREGLLLKELRAEGGRFYFEPRARVSHVNPSSLAATAALRFDAGRLYGARRATAGRWSAAKRAAYVLGGPLIPFLRFVRLRAELFGAGRRAPGPGIYPALFLGLTFDGLGQMAGYLAGAGRAPERLAVFEMDRARHLTRRDRAALAA